MSKFIVRPGCMNVAMVAERLNCSPSHVYWLRDNKGLPLKMPRGNTRGGLYVTEADYKKWERDYWC